MIRGEQQTIMKKETIKIGIYDFEQSQQMELRRLINSVMPSADICGYRSAGELFKDIKIPSGCPEILFLDGASAKKAGVKKSHNRAAEYVISLFSEKADALEVADYISKQKEKAGESVISGIPLVIIVTGESCRMKDIMGVHAFTYLEEPFRIARVADVLKSAVRELKLSRRADDLLANISRDENFLVAKTGAEVRRIPFSEILYVESMSRKVVVKLVGEEIVYYDQISNLETVLGEGFYRIHRSYLVSLKYVIRLSRTEVEIANGEKLPLSKYRYLGFAEAFEKYIDSFR